MAQFAGPFNSGAGATFDEAKWRQMIGAMFISGVIRDALNELAVTAGSGMNVDIDTGRAIVDGEYYSNDASTSLAQVADATFSRINVIAVHINMTASTDSAGVSARSGAVITLAGTPSGSPSAPALTQVADTTWEIALAQVLIPNGASSSSSFTITDVRKWASSNLSAPFRVAANSYGHNDSPSLVVYNGNAGSAEKVYIGNDGIVSGNAVETHIQADHKGTATDVLQTVPDTTGSDPATLILGGSQGSGVQIRQSNLKVFSGSGNTTGVTHGLGQTPDIVLIQPHGITAEPIAANNLGATTVDIYCSGAWTAIAIKNA